MTGIEEVQPKVTVPQTQPDLRLTDSAASRSTPALVSTTATASLSTPTIRLPESPLDDPRVGWIHVLNKDELIREMLKHGLYVEGRVEDLRKRFCSFWREQQQI